MKFSSASSLIICLGLGSIAVAGPIQPGSNEIQTRDLPARDVSETAVILTARGRTYRINHQNIDKKKVKAGIDRALLKGKKGRSVSRYCAEYLRDKFGYDVETDDIEDLGLSY